MATKTKTAARVNIALVARFLESEGGPNDATREVPVLIIKEGMGNKVDRHFYSADLLERAAAKFDGIKAYADHPSKSQETDQPERSIKGIVGYYHSPRVITIEGKKAIAATLKIIEGTAYDWAWNLVKEAAAFAKKFPDKEFVGVSINAWGKSHQEEVNGKTINFVDDFSEVQSADIVTQAGAGGGFRLRESIKKALHREGGSQGDKMDIKEALAKHGEGLKTLHDQIKANPDHSAAYGPSVEAMIAHHAEMMKSCDTAPAADPAAPPATPAADSPEAKKEAARQAELAADEAKLTEAYKSGKLSPVEKKLYEDRMNERAKAKIEKDAAFVEKSIRESGIPAAYAGDLPILCLGKSEAEVKALVETRKALLPGAPRINGNGAGGPKGDGKDSKLGSKISESGIKLVEAKK